MLWEQPVQYASQSDVGLRRENNEDSYVVRIQREEEAFASHGHLFVVADGMGGHAVGELASKLAVETVPLAFYKSNEAPADALHVAIEEANRVIHERGSANHDFRRMGTTCSSLLLSPEGAIVGHVGDSRVYRVRDHRIDQLTFDHSLQWELRRATGRSAEDVEANEPRNVITRSLGPEPAVEVDVEGPFPVAAGDRFVLCSDGLSNHLKDDEIGAAVQTLPPSDACRLLVNLALLRGGTDNVTVVVVDVGRGSSPRLEETVTQLPVPRNGTTSGELVGFGLAALLLVGGLLLAGLGAYWNAGSAVAVLGIAIGIACVLMRMRRRANDPSIAPLGPADTVVWRPHASAGAQLTRRFVEGLGTLDEELARTAREDDWTIDWSARDPAAEEARTAFRQKRFPEAFAAWARSVSYLVAGILDRRKRMVQEARWGKSTAGEDAGPG